MTERPSVLAGVLAVSLVVIGLSAAVLFSLAFDQRVERLTVRETDVQLIAGPTVTLTTVAEPVTRRTSPAPAPSSAEATPSASEPSPSVAPPPPTRCNVNRPGCIVATFASAAQERCRQAGICPDQPSKAGLAGIIGILLGSLAGFVRATRGTR